MSLTLTGRAPLAIHSHPEVVASARGWYLAVVHHEPDNRQVPKHYRLDRRACLDLLLAVKRAWWRIQFSRAARNRSPGMQIEGLYVTSPLVEVAHSLLGEHVRVLGVKLRTAKSVRAFRQSLIASMRLGRQLVAELARNAAKLAWPAEPASSRSPSDRAVVLKPRPRCLIPQPASWRPIAPPRHSAPASAATVLMLPGAAREAGRSAALPEAPLLPDRRQALEVDPQGDAHPHAA